MTMPSVRKDAGKLELSLTTATKNGTTSWKTVYQFPIKVGIYLVCNQAAPLLGIHPRKIKTYF